MKSKKSRDRFRHLQMAIFAFIILILVSTIGYMIIEHLSFLDAFYMTVITISTVGYSEVHPLSSGGRIFTSFIIVISLAVVVYLTTSVVELLLEGRMLDVVGRRKTLRELKEIAGHCIICGYGRIGKQVARECKSQGMEVVVIEKDKEVEKQCAKEGFLTVRGDAADESVLRQAGIDRAKGLVTALSSDADNLFVTMTARILRPDLFIVGRCNADETESKLYRAGADRAISPHNMGAKYMAALMLKPLVCDFLDVVTHGEPVELSLEGITIEEGSPAAGRRARDILANELKSIAILGIKKPRQNFYVNPRGDTVLDAGDIVIVYGSGEQLDTLKELCKAKR